MSDYFPIKRGDTGPDLVATLKNPDGSVPPLTGATIYFMLRAANGRYEPLTTTTLVNALASLVSATTGEVKYVWVAGNTDQTPGFYVGEFEAVLVGGQRVTYPNGGWVPIRIYQDLGTGGTP